MARRSPERVRHGAPGRPAVSVTADRRAPPGQRRAGTRARGRTSTGSGRPLSDRPAAGRRLAGPGEGQRPPRAVHERRHSRLGHRSRRFKRTPSERTNHADPSRITMSRYWGQDPITGENKLQPRACRAEPGKGSAADDVSMIELRLLFSWTASGVGFCRPGCGKARMALCAVWVVGHQDGEDNGVIDDGFRRRPPLRQTQRWLIAAAAVLAVAGAVATEALSSSAREQSVDRRGRATERAEPVQSPSPSCSWLHEAETEATAEARPGDREFRVVAANSLCSVAKPRLNEKGR